jgi:GTP-binding nuclear protein Ran
MDQDRKALELFSAYMKTDVIPILLEGAISSDEEAKLLIDAQWKEMPKAEKDIWLAKAAKPETAAVGSHTKVAHGACSHISMQFSYIFIINFHFSSEKNCFFEIFLARAFCLCSRFLRRTHSIILKSSPYAVSSAPVWNSTAPASVTALFARSAFESSPSDSPAQQQGSPSHSIFTNVSGGGGFSFSNTATALGPAAGPAVAEASTQTQTSQFGGFGSSVKTSAQGVPTQFKVILAGDGGVGKTTFVRRFNTGEFVEKYVGTLNGSEKKNSKNFRPPILAHLHHFSLISDDGCGCECNYYGNIERPRGSEGVGHGRTGKIRRTSRWLLVRILDFSHPFYYIFVISNLRYSNSIQGQAAIVMFYVTSRISYKNVPNWHRDIVRVCEQIPIVLVGNKVDVLDRKVLPKNIMFHRKKNLQYYDLSIKSNYNIERPFLYLMRVLLSDPNLMLVSLPAFLEPQGIDADAAAALEADFKKLQVEALPLDDEEDF